MNEKVNLPELSDLLSQKTGITKKDAESFLREVFDLIFEKLLEEKTVKIPKLGTFKIVSVEERESISVHSGERVLIPAHVKVNFSADKQLSQTVNEPFEWFEAVEIDEEKAFENTSSDESTTSEGEEEKIIPESENQVDVSPDEKNEEVFQEKPSEYSGNVNNLESKPDKAHHFHSFLAIGIPIFSIVAVIFLGYYLYTLQVNPENFEHESTSKQVVFSIPEAPKDSVASFSVNSDTVAELEPVVSKKDTIASVPQQIEPPAKIKKHIITEGERLTIIAQREYGNKIFWIYLYEENKSVIKSPDEVHPGIEIVIPPAVKYGIDKNDPKSVEDARKKSLKDH